MGCTNSKKPVLPVPQPDEEGLGQVTAETRASDKVPSPVGPNSAHVRMFSRDVGLPAPVPLAVLPAPAPPGEGTAPPSAAGGGDVNYRAPKEGATALIAAIKRGDSKVIGEAISARPEEVNLAGMWGNTPAILAAQYGRAEVLRLLMDAGADLRGLNEYNAGALLFACMEGFPVELVAGMLERGAVIDPPPARVYNTRTDAHARLTPLLAAATNGHLDLVRLLLDKGALLDRGVLASVALLDELAAQEKESIPASLPSSPPLAPPALGEPRGVTPLLAACGHGHDDVALLLLTRGADISAVDTWGNHALLLAASTAKKSSTILALLQPLPLGPCAADPEVRRALVNRGNSMTIAPLHAAAENNLVEGVDALVRAGADVDAKTRSGETPLMRAIGRGDANLEVVRKLVSEHGADLNAVDGRGKTAFDLLAVKGRRCAAIRQFLEAQGAQSAQAQPEGASE